jgi:hypothetical protein
LAASNTPAPGWFTTNTGTFMLRAITAANRRSMVSGPLPGGCAHTMVIGFDG